MAETASSTSRADAGEGKGKGGTVRGSRIRGERVWVKLGWTKGRETEKRMGKGRRAEDEKMVVGVVVMGSERRGEGKGGARRRKRATPLDPANDAKHVPLPLSEAAQMFLRTLLHILHR